MDIIGNFFIYLFFHLHFHFYLTLYGNKLSFQPYIPICIQIQELKLPSSFLLTGNRNGNKIFFTIP